MLTPEDATGMEKQLSLLSDGFKVHLTHVITNPQVDCLTSTEPSNQSINNQPACQGQQQTIIQVSQDSHVRVLVFEFC